MRHHSKEPIFWWHDHAPTSGSTESAVNYRVGERSLVRTGASVHQCGNGYSEVRFAVNVDDNLREEIKRLLELDRLKDVERQNPLSSGPRRERVAEHSWHLAAAVIMLSDHIDAEIDLGRATMIAVAHDIVETYVGDTFAYGSETDGQHDREHRAMKELQAASHSPGVNRLIDCWNEYEDQVTPEAKFVKGLDAFLPILLNYHNAEHSSWVAHKVRADRVTARMSSHGNMGDSLRAQSEKMIAQASERGDLL